MVPPYLAVPYNSVCLCILCRIISKASEVINPLVSKQFVNCVLIWLLKMLMPSLVWCAKRKIRLMMTPLRRAGTENDRINDRNYAWVLVVMALGWELTGTGLWFSW